MRKCEVRRSERPLRKYAETKSTFCKSALMKCLTVWALISNSGIFLENSIAALKVKVKVNPLKTKRRPLYLKTQSVPRCKHFSSRL